MCRWDLVLLIFFGGWRPPVSHYPTLFWTRETQKSTVIPVGLAVFSKLIWSGYKWNTVKGNSNDLWGMNSSQKDENAFSITFSIKVNQQGKDRVGAKTENLKWERGWGRPWRNRGDKEGAVGNACGSRLSCTTGTVTAKEKQGFPMGPGEAWKRRLGAGHQNLTINLTLFSWSESVGNVRFSV